MMTMTLTMTMTMTTTTMMMTMMIVTILITIVSLVTAPNRNRESIEVRESTRVVLGDIPNKGGGAVFS